MTALLAGCGGGSDSSPTTTAQAAPSPARALDALVRASRSEDAAAIRRLVTAGSHPQTSELAEGLGSFAGLDSRRLYVGGDWGVATISGARSSEGMRGRGAYAAAFRLVDGRWRADLSGRVRIRILGPDPGSTTGSMPQVAAEIRSPDPLAESGLWVDGEALQVKGGGTPTRGTIYGAPAADLKPGPHVAVAYARTARNGTAVAWPFTSR